MVTFTTAVSPSVILLTLTVKSRSVLGSTFGLTSNVVVFSAGLNLLSPLNLAVIVYLPAVNLVIL